MISETFPRQDHEEEWNEDEGDERGEDGRAVKQ